MKVYGTVTDVVQDDGDIRPDLGALIYVRLQPGESIPEGTSVQIEKFDHDVRFDAGGGIWARRTADGPLIHFAEDGLR